MYIKSIRWRCYVSMALVNFSRICLTDRASAELEQGKKRKLARTAGNPTVYLARSWQDTWPDCQGKMRNFHFGHCLESNHLSGRQLGQILAGF